MSKEGAILGLVHELTKGCDVPTDIIHAHISKLQSQVGLKSGTVQQLSEKKLTALADLSGNFDEFSKNFKYLSDNNCPNLVPMAEILHGIAFDEQTKYHLRSKASALETDGINMLKEKLLQQVGSRVVGSTTTGLLGPGMRNDPFSHRPFCTLDFSTLDIENKSNPAGPLSCLPVNSQETSLVQDLIYCFIGIPGVFIKPVLGKTDITFEIDKKVNPSLHELLEKMTPLCNHYSVIVRFVERYSQMGSGCVNQSFAGGLASVLKDYYIFVSQLERQHRLGLLTLQKIWSYLQPTMDAMSMMADLCLTVDKNNAKGGKTLSLLHEKCVLQASTSRNPIHDLGRSLVKTAAEPFFRILTKWIHRGSVEDPGKDFFVEDNEVIERAILPLEYSDDYWEKRYTIKPDLVPSFLHSHADKILRTGKYLNVIQQCDQSKTDQQRRKKKKRVLIFKNSNDVIDGIDESEDPVTGFNSKDVDGELHYMESADGYVEPLEKAYVYASKTLLELLVGEKDLIGHLRSVKHYFLMDQGDFIVQFMDSCSEELRQGVESIEPNRLESLLELALRTSSVNSDPYKDNVRVELLPYDLIYQMCKILSIDTKDEAEFKGPVNRSDLTTLEAFAFGYDVHWPISLILNRKSLACYQMLCRHLLYCKHVEKLLSNVWISTKSLKSLSADYLPSFALKQKMLHFLLNLEYHMTFEVLEPNWQSMISKIQSGKVTNIDQVLQIHSDFLSTCLNDCLLSSPQLLITVKKLMGVCCRFSDYINAMANQDEMSESFIMNANVESFDDELKKFDFEFTGLLVSLLDKISQLARENYNERILNILHRLDFNGFYSRALDTFGSCTSQTTVE